MGADARLADDMTATLVLHQHPFAAFCQKVLVALYELDVPFRTHLVDGADARAELAGLWPPASIPVLRDESANLTIPESTTIIEYLDGDAVEYLDGVAAGGPRLVPADRADALQARLWDRVFDQHVAAPMQKIVGDRLRPAGREDPEGVAEAAGRSIPRMRCSMPSSRNGPGRQARRSPSPMAPRRRRCSTRAPSIAGTRTPVPT